MGNALAHRNIAPLAFFFEAALGLLAIGLGNWFDVDPLENASLNPETRWQQASAVGWGLLATLPVMIFIPLGMRLTRRISPRIFSLLIVGIIGLMEVRLIWGLVTEG